MNSSILKEVLLRQQKTVVKDYVEREKRKEIEKNLNNSFVILLSGIRRCGKSTLLRKIFSENSYYVNFDDERFIQFSVKDFSKLYEILKELFGEKKYFVFDEIQNIKGWERFVRRLHNEGNKIFITGSNASLLSKDFGTHLTGRNITLSLFPFSFKEYILYKNKKFDEKRLISDDRAEIKKLFNEYSKKGGFPEYIKTENSQYLQALYDNILYKDIVTRYKLQTERQLKEIVYFATSNLSKEISFNSLKNLVQLSNTTTIRDYFYYLENSYLLFLVHRYNISLKKQIQVPKKVYCVDLGLAISIGFNFSENKGRILENLVFIELKRNGKEIYYHKEKHECDFVIKEGMKIVEAIQVCYELNDENRKREYTGILEAMNNYKLKQGLVLTYDDEDEMMIDKKKIIIKPVWKWLIEK